jgi:hypothetical protein
MNTANARKRTVNARVHSFGRGVRFDVAVVWRQGEVARLSAAIEANQGGKARRPESSAMHPVREKTPVKTLVKTPEKTETLEKTP